MERIILNSPKRVRLTREELLAGKCVPDGTSLSNKEADPRIKSPDMVLQRNADTLNDTASTQAGQHAEKMRQLQKELGELKLRYNREINEWKEYEKSVAEWKKQVLEIVQQLKQQADGENPQAA